jgi:poly(A) polymerase
MSELHPAKRAELAALENAEWLKRKETRAVFEALSAESVETRAVGGAVRNTLLGLPVKEVDLATTAVPERVLSLAENAGLKAVPTGIDHGTVTVIADGVPFEVTTLRRDVETFGRHANVAFTNHWEDDARRRDFTMNALYADRDGRLFDPLGGLGDLLSGRVRFIGNAEARIKEDYLRILRFFRFHAYYGKGEPDEDGLAASLRLRAGLDQLSAERIWGELKRILVAPKAVRAVYALFDYGLLTDLLGGVPRLRRFETLVAIEEGFAIAADAALRLAALAVFVEEDASRLALRLRLSNAEQETLALAARPSEPRLPTECAAKRALYRLGVEAYRFPVLIAWASSAPADNRAWYEAYSLPERWQAPSFPLRGSDFAALGLKGPEIGHALRRLEQDWLEAGFALSREQLLSSARQIADEAR